MFAVLVMTVPLVKLLFVVAFRLKVRVSCGARAGNVINWAAVAGTAHAAAAADCIGRGLFIRECRGRRNRHYREHSVESGVGDSADGGGLAGKNLMRRGGGDGHHIAGAVCACAGHDHRMRSEVKEAASARLPLVTRQVALLALPPPATSVGGTLLGAVAVPPPLTASGPACA